MTMYEVMSDLHEYGKRRVDCNEGPMARPGRSNAVDLGRMGFAFCAVQGLQSVSLSF